MFADMYLRRRRNGEESGWDKSNDANLKVEGYTVELDRKVGWDKLFLNFCQQNGQNICPFYPHPSPALTSSIY